MSKDRKYLKFALADKNRRLAALKTTLKSRVEDVNRHLEDCLQTEGTCGEQNAINILIHIIQIKSEIQSLQMEISVIEMALN